jgi:hypothetical protein
MTAYRSLALAVGASSLLSACGGGGGGGGVREVQFTSFDAVGTNEVVVMQGTSQTASGTMTVGAGGDISVTTADVGAPADGTLRLTYDGGGNLSAISFNTPSASGSFNNVSCQSGVCAAETATSAVIGIDARAIGWNYQTFGVWFQQSGPTSFQAGAMSAGAMTPTMPMAGTAVNFTGLAAGFYVDPFGLVSATAATMNATVNFETRNIAFSTTGTTAADLNTGSSGPRPTLDLSGTLNYNPGSSQFTGVVNTPGATLTGTATGRFYGPNADEMGGTYGLNGASQPERMFGGFGAKRQ